MSNASGQTNITLNFNSLPSAQGWVFEEVGNSAPESAVFSVSGNVLHQNTIGTGFQGSSHIVYVLPNVVSSNQPFVLTLRARLLQEENLSGNHYGFGVGVYAGDTNGGYIAGFSLGAGILLGGGNGNAVALDTSLYHDFRVQGDLGARTNFQIFVDDVLIMSNAAVAGYVPPFQGPEDYRTPFAVNFGDGTGGQNAQADISYFSFQQFAVQQPTVPVSIFPAVEITWSSNSNVQYQVQWTSQLNSNQWNDLGNPVTGTGTNNSVFDSTRSSPARFYRVNIVQ